MTIVGTWQRQGPEEKSRSPQLLSTQFSRIQLKIFIVFPCNLPHRGVIHSGGNGLGVIARKPFSLPALTAAGGKDITN